MTRVLFTKNFSGTAAQLRALHGSRYEVWASHTDPHHGMMAAADHSFLEPARLIGAGYCGWLLQECRARGIDIVLPGKERELLADHQDEFLQRASGS